MGKSGDIKKDPPMKSRSQENPAPFGGTVPATEVPCRIVGIGASVGAQEALEQLFNFLPSDCNLAFVVIMHLPPAVPSFLSEMLGRYTAMKVVIAEEGMAPRPDTVHVIPAGSELELSGGRFRLEARGDQHEAYHPIDRFFCSLASEMGERSIAVILSGSGTDGTEGAMAVKEAGGFVIVQDPGAATHPAKPQGAIAAGAADLILPAEELAETIAGLARGVCPLSDLACNTATLDEDLSAVFALVKVRTGHDFSSYKRSTVIRRIERRMAVNDVAGMKKYIALLEANEQEARALGQEILIGVTSFFRDPEAFEVLRRQIIPALFANRDPDQPVRIWHACCATGEEVYSTSILIREYLKEQRIEAKVQLFATDIDQSAIAHARAGLYPDAIEADVGKERLNTFFARVDGRWQVAKQLREMIVFAHHSIIKDPPFSRLDLLVCRNFLIYLNPDMQKRLISLFHLALNPGGCLFLGASETVGRHSDSFSPIDKKWKIFQRLDESRREPTIFPFTAPLRLFPGLGLSPRPAGAGELKPGQLAEKLLMERYFPPCIVVNENYDMVHTSARGIRYLEVPEGAPTRDLLKMARAELRAPLRAALYKAFTDQKPVVFRGVKVTLNGEEAAVNVLVEPLNVPPPAEKLAMVILEPALPPASHPGPAAKKEALVGDETSKDRLISQLEEQLRITHEQLQAVTEQLETSQEGFMSANEELMSINEEYQSANEELMSINEEYQSANEELQSTNEELETSKEELQALNEELVTVNTELQGKVEELDRANSDMENLFKSSEIATIFLDRRFTIKRFSPAMASIFSLIPADIGRPFRHLAGTIDWACLPEDAGAVLASLAPVEREVASLEGDCHYLMRVLPYRTTEGRVDGVAVTLVDITERKRAELRLQKLDQQRQLALDAARMGWWHYDPVTQVASWDERYKEIFAVSGYQSPNEEILARIHPEDLPEVWAKVEAALNPANPLPYRAEYRINLPDGSMRWIEAHGIASFEGTGENRQATGFVGTVADITKRKQAVQELQESEQRVRRKLASVLSPEGDLGVLDLADLIDASALQKLMDDFYPVARIPMSIIDINGRVLVGVGWQDICTRFHRVQPETARHCRESDTQLASDLAQGECRIYKCKNNLWDMATPITVAGQHLGNIFTGQFFFEDEPIDRNLFRAQAEEFGFDEEQYLAALDRVPRLSRQTVERGMAFFLKLADTLSQLGYSNAKLARLLAERDRLTDSLLESRAKLDAALNSMPEAVFISDAQGRLVEFNDAFASFHRFGNKEECAKSFAEYPAILDVVLPNGEPAPPEQWAVPRALRGETVANAEYTLRRKDTGKTWVGCFSFAPIRDKDGEIVGSVVVGRDITEHKKLENQYLHVQKMESIGKLAGGVAHDFNNILTAIAGFVHVTLLKMAADDPLRRNIEQVLKATDRAASLTRELLLFSRKQPSERHSVDLNGIILKLELFLHRTLGADIALNIVPHTSPLPVLVDSHQIQQVLMNLAVNARDVMPQGGSLTMQAAPMVLREDFVAAHGYGKPGPYALLTVSDTGSGMDNATLQQIFEPFFTTKDVGKGTGLGLAVVYGIVKQHEGFITVYSEPDQGSTFRIHLPLTASPAAPAELPGRESKAMPGGTETILLAEDDELVRDLVTRVLGDAGYQVLTAVDGEAAVRKFKEHADAIHLLLFDLIMPKMNGMEACNQIRRIRPELKVIFASGYAPEQVQQKAANAVGSHFVFKPVAPTELLHKVRSVLDGDI